MVFTVYHAESDVMQQQKDCGNRCFLLGPLQENQRDSGEVHIREPEVTNW
jgi:hypothetical protein